MGLGFGTSGLRGRSRDLTDAVCADYTRAFLAYMVPVARLWLGRDLRASSPRIAAAVAQAALAEGVDVIDCGPVPSPALALAAQTGGGAAIMVTGSHIPADRNGLKFFGPTGEITKADEAAILGYLRRPLSRAGAGRPTQDDRVGEAWVARAVAAFPPQVLAGVAVGLWDHSAVGADLVARALASLGARVERFGASRRFVPVDTEALDPAMLEMIAGRSGQGWFAILSTDPDSDRPLVADANGRVIPGDLLGLLTASVLGAEAIVTPLTSNSAVERSGQFGKVVRTRVGAPHVIAAMTDTGGKVAGFEANGGFLLGFQVRGPGGSLPPLLTRDSLLPILAPLVLARGQGCSLADLIDRLPRRFTASDRLRAVPTRQTRALLDRLLNTHERAAFLRGLGQQQACDLTDGVRITCQDGLVLHLRASGNAPELRAYAEADSPEGARRAVGQLLARALAWLQASSSGARVLASSALK